MMQPPESLTVINEVRDLGVFVVYDIIVGASNTSYPEGLEREVESAVGEARRALSLAALKDNPVIRAYRDFYWRVLKIDPTKQRPAQEALLRRILRGEPLPRISPAVDAGNAASIKYLVPIGLYDIGKISGRTLYLRRARRGEVFRPVGGRPFELADNQIVLASGGQILHVYPYRDSIDTVVDERTRDFLVVIAGAPGVERERLVGAALYLRKLFSLLGGIAVGEIRTA